MIGILALGGKITSGYQLMLVSLVFLLIPIATWFFSFRPDLFRGLFARSTEAQTNLRRHTDAEFKRGMRIIALLQFVFVLVLFIIGLVWWLRDAGY